MAAPPLAAARRARRDRRGRGGGAEPAGPLGCALAARSSRRQGGRAGALLAACPGPAPGDEPRRALARAGGRLEAPARELWRRVVLSARAVRGGDPSEPTRRARPEGRGALDARAPCSALPDLDRHENRHAPRLSLPRPPADRGRRRNWRLRRRTGGARPTCLAAGAGGRLLERPRRGRL